MTNQNITKILWIHVQIRLVWILSLELSWFFAWHLHSIIYNPHPHITLLVLDTKKIVLFTIYANPHIPKLLTSGNNSLNGPARFSPTFKIDVHKRTKFISPIQIGIHFLQQTSFSSPMKSLNFLKCTTLGKENAISN